MRNFRILPLMAMVFLAGALFFAGCEKEKKAEIGQEPINESNYNTIPLDEYIKGVWISDQSTEAYFWIDSMVFQNHIYYGNCSGMSCPYTCSKTSGKDTIYLPNDKTSSYPMRIKRIAADTLAVCESNYCTSFSQIARDVWYIRTKNNVK